MSRHGLAELTKELASGGGCSPLFAFGKGLLLTLSQALTIGFRVGIEEGCQRVRGALLRRPAEQSISPGLDPMVPLAAGASRTRQPIERVPDRFDIDASQPLGEKAELAFASAMLTNRLQILDSLDDIVVERNRRAFRSSEFGEFASQFTNGICLALAMALARFERLVFRFIRCAVNAHHSVNLRLIVSILSRFGRNTVVFSRHKRFNAGCGQGDR